MPFPLADGARSPVLDELVGGPAAALTAVALVVGPRARASGWASSAAIALAARWRGPRRVLLADLDLEQPTLHGAAGVPNEEGVIDLVDYGISLARLIRTAGGGAYDLLPAGIFTPDPGSILRHEGWGRVLVEVAARRGTLLAWVPADADGVDAVVERAGAVLVLAEADEGREVVERLAHPYAVLAILTPEPIAPPAPEPGIPAEEPAAEAPEPLAEAPEPTAEPAAEAPEPAAEAPEPAVEAPEPAAEVPVPAAEPPLPAWAVAVRGVSVPEEAVAPEFTAPVAEPIAPTAEAADGPEAVPVSEPAAEPEALALEESVPAEDAALPVGPAAVAAHDATTRDEAFDRIRLPQDAASREALIRDLRDRQRAARLGMAPHRAEIEAMGAAVQLAPVAEAEVLETPPSATIYGVPERRTHGPVKLPPVKRRRFTRPILWTIGVVLLASLLAGAWHFLGGRLSPPEPPIAEPVVEPEPPAVIVQDALPYVVAMEAHRDLTVAMERVADLTEIEREMQFHIESLERNGALFYHVMAGPVPDSAAALALRDTLIARGHKTGPTPTDVRATPLAFLIGDYATPAAAAEQRDVLRRLDIPGYVLRARAADGRPLYRLYVGGFSGAAEADVTAQMLRAAGIKDSLVTRTGSVASTDSLVTNGQQ